MSILDEVMADARGVVHDALGHTCTLTNTATGEATPGLKVVINTQVKLYQDGVFGGLVTTAVFDRSECDPKIGDELHDEDTGIIYTLEAVKDETVSKRTFIVGED